MPKTIFITGAAAGIGAATARLFAGKGWCVGASDVNRDGLKKLQKELGNDRVGLFEADVRDHDSVERALRAFMKTTGGRLDAVFANAGVLFMGPDESIPLERKHLLVDVNVTGVINTLAAAFPYLKETPGAHAVAMSSTSAEYGAPHHAVYSATKFFVRGYTEALNLEWRAHGIQVSAIYVAYVQTGMVFDAEVKAASIDAIGVKVKPEEVAAAVWRAVHGDQVHWHVGFDAKALNVAARLFGESLAPVIRRLAKV